MAGKKISGKRHTIWTAFSRRFFELYPEASRTDLQNAMRQARVIPNNPSSFTAKREWAMCSPQSPHYVKPGEEISFADPLTDKEVREKAERRLQRADWANISGPAASQPQREIYPLAGIEAMTKRDGFPPTKKRYRAEQKAAVALDPEQRDELQHILAHCPSMDGIVYRYNNWSNALGLVTNEDPARFREPRPFSRGRIAELARENTVETREDRRRRQAGEYVPPTLTRKEQTPITPTLAEKMQKRFGVKVRAEPDRFCGCPVARVEVRPFYDTNSRTMQTGAVRYELR